MVRSNTAQGISSTANSHKTLKFVVVYFVLGPALHLIVEIGGARVQSHCLLCWAPCLMGHEYILLIVSGPFLFDSTTLVYLK